MYQNDDLEQQLRANKPVSIEPPLHYRERLKTKLLAQYAQPRTTPLDIHLNIRRLTMIAIPVIAALAIGMIVWFSNAVPVSAAEIVNRASQAVNSTGAANMQSYQGVQVFWERSYIALESMGDLKLSSQQVVWVQGNKARYESYAVVGSNVHDKSDKVVLPAVAAPRSTPVPYSKDDTLAFTTLRVIDGKDIWVYSVDPPNVVVRSLVKPGVSKISAPDDMQSLMAMLVRDNENVKLIGSGVIAGRNAYILRYTPKPGVLMAPYLSSVISYIDKQTYIPLASQYLNAKDDVLLKWEYTEFDTQPQLDDTLFRFQIPSKTKVQDLRTTNIPTRQEMLEAWNNAASTVQFSLFIPTELPETLIAEKPEINRVTSESSFLYFAVRQNFYTRDNEQPSLYIGQWPQDKSGTPPGQETVQIGTIEGKYDKIDNVFHGIHMLTFVRDGTMIQLVAAMRDFTKADLIKIASSMQPVDEVAAHSR